MVDERRVSRRNNAANGRRNCDGLSGARRATDQGADARTGQRDRRHAGASWQEATKAVEECRRERA